MTRRRPRFSARAQAVLAAAAALLPTVAVAHGSNSGLGALWDDWLHPLTVPAHLVGLLAWGGWLGQQHPSRAAPALGTLAASLLLGLGFSAWDSGFDNAGHVLVAGLLFALGTLSRLATPPAWGLALTAVLGGSLGLASGPEGLAGWPRCQALAVAWLGALAVTTLVAAAARALDRPLRGVALRVAASWLAASALVVLALAWLPMERPTRMPAPGPTHEPARPTAGQPAAAETRPQPDQAPR